MAMLGNANIKASVQGLNLLHPGFAIAQPALGKQAIRCR